MTDDTETKATTSREKPSPPWVRVGTLRPGDRFTFGINYHTVDRVPPCGDAVRAVHASGQGTHMHPSTLVLPLP